MALKELNTTEGNRTWMDELGYLIKENHSEEDKLKKLMYSQNIDDIRLAITIIKQKKQSLDLPYLFDFVRIEPGFFYKGESKTRTVIEKPYYINKFMCTQGLFLAIMGHNPSAHTGDLRLPLENVTWDEIVEFMNKMKEILPTFRMPYEDEWEYAADGGHLMPKDEKGNPIQDVYGGFSDLNEVDDYAWYNENSDGHTHPVGLKKATRLGLHDVTGNCFEWTVAR